MSRYLDLAVGLAHRVADGDLAPGASLTSVRTLAVAEDTTAATVARAYQELAAAGVLSAEPRRSARVAADGVAAARAYLRGARSFRLAGSDDPALSLLVAAADRAVAPVGARGSYRGLTALWSGEADGAALHLRHHTGEYNAPFARHVLASRRPVLVHLWRREQGLILPPGNPRGAEAIGDLARLRVARRAPGTGTRTLMDRLLRDAGIDPDAVRGPLVELHLDVAIAVATGEVDAGVGLRATAATLELDFVPLTWEPFQVATTEVEAGGVRPLVELLDDAPTRARVDALGGYDLAGAGELLAV